MIEPVISEHRALPGPYEQTRGHGNQEVTVCDAVFEKWITPGRIRIHVRVKLVTRSARQKLRCLASVISRLSVTIASPTSSSLKRFLNG